MSYTPIVLHFKCDSYTSEKKKNPLTKKKKKNLTSKLSTIYTSVYIYF